MIKSKEDKGYTTKPVEPPLSTEKEYVLVDVEGYKGKISTNEPYVTRFRLDEPFKITSVSGFGDGLINKTIIVDKGSELKYFREVIRNAGVETPEEKEALNAIKPVEWVNGDECEYYYWEGCTWSKGIYVTFDNGNHVVRDFGDDDIYTGVASHNIRKPETPEQRKERERTRAIDEIAGFIAGLPTSVKVFPLSIAERLYDAGYVKGGE